MSTKAIVAVSVSIAVALLTVGTSSAFKWTIAKSTGFYNALVGSAIVGFCILMIVAKSGSVPQLASLADMLDSGLLPYALAIGAYMVYNGSLLVDCRNQLKEPFYKRGAKRSN